MTRKTLLTTATALVFAVILGFTGMAKAQPHMGYQNMSPEQCKVMQDAHAEFAQKMEPLRRDLYAKQTELNSLYAQGTPQTDPKVQTLTKEIGDLDAKLSAAGADMRKQLSDKGIPVYAGMGHGNMGHNGMMGGNMGHGGMMNGGCPMMGMSGHGHNSGTAGHGMMQRGGCGW